MVCRRVKVSWCWRQVNCGGKASSRARSGDRETGDVRGGADGAGSESVSKRRSEGGSGHVDEENGGEEMASG